VTEPLLSDAGFPPEATTTVSSEHARLLAATLDVEARLVDGGELPLPWHWAYFPPEVPTGALGPDGHPRRREELDAYPQRMWVGGRVRAIRPLMIGSGARRRSRLVSTERKDGASGRFWLLTVSHAITQDGEVRVEEEQDLVLREPPVASSAPGPDLEEAPADDWVEARTADSVLLFRYSALTFNSHRIHYDQHYATEVEGHPDLVVQGPLVATLLCDLARRRLPDRDVGAFAFRARAPLFANRRFWLTGHPSGDGATLVAVRGDGVPAMTLDLQDRVA
jgi:3-methylfumaryl-CoA hydratase